MMAIEVRAQCACQLISGPACNQTAKLATKGALSLSAPGPLPLSHFPTR